MLKFEKDTVDPPVMHTWSVDEPLDSNGAGLPFPAVSTAPVTTIPGAVVAGVFAGQTETS